jgi:hypothetical protein
MKRLSYETNLDNEKNKAGAGLSKISTIFRQFYISLGKKFKFF